MLANQVGISDKCVSERHAKASESKLTAGEASKILKKRGVILSAKEVVNAFKILKGCEPEWHHSGFYKGSKGSTMGRTFFFAKEQVDYIALEYTNIETKIAENTERQRQLVEKNVTGFYYTWDSDYSGNYGKKVNYKVLQVYQGSVLNIPKNFVPCHIDVFENAKKLVGKKYYGWSEPAVFEF